MEWLDGIERGKGPVTVSARDHCLSSPTSHLRYVRQWESGCRMGRCVQSHHCHLPKNPKHRCCWCSSAHFCQSSYLGQPANFQGLGFHSLWFVLSFQCSLGHDTLLGVRADPALATHYRPDVSNHFSSVPSPLAGSFGAGWKGRRVGGEGGAGEWPPQKIGNMKCLIDKSKG